MEKDQAIGALILVGSLAGIGMTLWLLIVYATIMLQLSAFVAVAAILGILAWIGWTMATTPPPESIGAESLKGMLEAETSSTAASTTSPTVAEGEQSQKEK